MRVAVIAAEMEGRATGVGRYLAGLLHGLDQWDHGLEWHLYFQGEPSSSPALPNGPFQGHFSRHHGSRVLWEQHLVSREISKITPDVVFGPAYTVPFGLRAPAGVTLHDLSFEVLPEEFGWRERWRRRLLARRAARVARRVIADTRHLASQIAGRYGVEEDRLAVVPLGVDTGKFSSRPSDGDAQALKELGVRPPYILVPGTILERRMPRQVLDAFAILKRDRPELELVTAGANRLRRRGDLETWIDGLGLQAAVRRLGWVEDKALAPLYRGAEAALYVSRYEGFGLPPLECLACGTPVVVSPGLGLDDAWPDYPYRLTELDSESIALALETVLEDEDQRSRVMSLAGGVVGDLGWEQSSRHLVSELSRAVAS
jgi:glycosyltransferase involved in cell wall biosynthesis